jgi:hypothetical protein
VIEIVRCGHFSEAHHKYLSVRFCEDAGSPG